jgi:hypothetical protein
MLTHRECLITVASMNPTTGPLDDFHDYPGMGWGDEGKLFPLRDDA